MGVIISFAIGFVIGGIVIGMLFIFFESRKEDTFYINEYMDYSNELEDE